MQFQFLPPTRINRLLRLQNGIALYYQKMADITTEKDIKRLLTTLQQHHSKVCDELKRMVYSNSNPVSISIGNGRSYLEKVWQKILLELLISNRTKIVEYCRQNEIKLLQELQGLISLDQISAEVRESLIQYEQSIYSYLEKLNSLPAEVTRKSRAA